MPHSYKSSNPVEASFVEAFFKEKGFACKLIPNNLYGFQSYNLYIEGEVSEEIWRELEQKLRRHKILRAVDE